MPDREPFVLVRADVLPEAFLKVLCAKELLAGAKAKTSAEACRMAGISRSAFYKYKDAVHRYEEQGDAGVTTFSLRLCDETGVLSSVLSAFAKYGANILTVNQNIPSDRVAYVTVAARIRPENKSPEELLKKLLRLGGVLECRVL